MATEQHQPNYSRVSYASMTVGLLSLPAAFLPFGIPVALLAVLLGFLARRDALDSARPIKMANAAIVLGVIAVLIWIAVIAGFALLARLTD